ncbi:MAG: hypothetical protein P4L35_20315 [Ignavibacteriaceae bacterium]|nr:hypothetical protein [Ignavibacteriaceae bacterium]
MEFPLNENFITFSKFLGYGDIKSKLWFVGIEDSGESITEVNLNERLSECREETLYINEVAGKNSVWSIIEKLLWDNFSIKHKLNEKEYLKKMFSKEYSYFFLTELFPLPKSINRFSWPERYKDIFEYSKDDYFKYLSDVHSFRYPIIHNKWVEVKPYLTICFGALYWDEFIHLFNLGHSKFIDLPDSGLRMFPSENILLSPFFDYRLRRNDILTLKQLIHDKIVKYL